jgi:hypothetical protein
MKKESALKYLFLISLIFIFACKKENTVSSTRPLEFKRNSFYDYYSIENNETLRSRALHLIYLNEVDASNTLLLKNNFNSEDFKDLKQSSDYNKFFKKLYVFRKDRIQLYYIPENAPIKWINENLDLEQNNLSKFIWIQNGNDRDGVSVAIETTIAEVLDNEKKFIIEKRTYQQVDQIELNNVSKFQKIVMSSTEYLSPPDFKGVRAEMTMERKCEPTIDSKHPQPSTCHCAYEIARPVDSYSQFNKTENNDYNIDIFLNSENTAYSQRGSNFVFDFQNENEINNMIISFKKYQDKEIEMFGHPVNNECPRTPNEKQNISSKYLYNVEVKLYGTRLMEKEFGKLPDSIKGA